MRTSILSCLLLATSARVASAQDEPILENAPVAAPSAPVNEAARQLFLANCASCHGEKGDGQGTTTLDRPARSFMDGGFSFGNTPETIFRTLSVGIPGTPMPSFDLLPEADRQLLAEYVITLGPPIAEVTDEQMILRVHDRPLVVRGLLPSIAEGAPRQPRGLLIGTTEGMTFEYRTDDVRLLGVRQGDFVKRTDWINRGGTPLEPLGKVVMLVEGGMPEATFRSGGNPLVARLHATRATKDWAALEYDLVDAGREVAHVLELPQVVKGHFGTGYQRSFFMTVGPAALEISVRTPALESARELASGESGTVRWHVAQPPEGLPVYVEISSMGTAQVSPDPRPGMIELTQSLSPGASKVGYVIRVLVLVGWNDDVRSQLEQSIEHKW